MADIAEDYMFHIRCVDSVEMKSFIGMLHARDLFGQNTHGYHILFREAIRHPIFGSNDVLKKLAFLHANITFGHF